MLCHNITTDSIKSEKNRYFDKPEPNKSVLHSLRHLLVCEYMDYYLKEYIVHISR